MAKLSWPNRVTITRVLLIVPFVLLLLYQNRPGYDGLARYLAMAIFVAMALSDALDGYLARRYGLETSFGRFADPLVDKILICGALIFLVIYLPGKPYMRADVEYANLTGWMVVLVVAREFIVSALRGYAESRKIKFGAIWWGKRKMFIQSLTIAAILAHHAFFYNTKEFRIGVIVLIWLSVVVTLLSGLMYLYRARKLLKGEHA